MKKLFSLVLICLWFCSCQLKIAQNTEIDFTDYFYYINMAMYAHEIDSLQNQDMYLWQAYYAHPKKNKIPAWLIGKLIPTYSLIDSVKLIEFIERHSIAISSNKFMHYIPETYKNITASHVIYNAKPSNMPFDYEALIADIDTLKAIDQYICGYRNIDTTLVADVYKSIKSNKYCSAEILVDELQKLHEQYGHFETMLTLTTYVHITNYDWFMRLNDHLLKSVKLGYMTPNEYAWVFDRSYNQKFGTFYYYFCMNDPFNTENHKSIEELSKAEKAEINQRRRKIGLAPLPHSFEFIDARIFYAN